MYNKERYTGYLRGSTKTYTHGAYEFTYNFTIEEYSIKKVGDNKTILGTASSIKQARKRIREFQLRDGLLPPERKEHDKTGDNQTVSGS